MCIANAVRHAPEATAWLCVGAGYLFRMKEACAVILLAGLTLAGCGKKEPAASAPPPQRSAAPAQPLSAPADYLGAVSKGQKSAIKTIDLASLGQAIKLFEVEEGRLPKDLNELVAEKYLPGLPAPPPGTKFVYDPNTGNVRVVKQ